MARVLLQKHHDYVAQAVTRLITSVKSAVGSS